MHQWKISKIIAQNLTLFCTRWTSWTSDDQYMFKNGKKKMSIGFFKKILLSVIQERSPDVTLTAKGSHFYISYSLFNLDNHYDNVQNLLWSTRRLSTWGGSWAGARQNWWRTAKPLTSFWISITFICQFGVRPIENSWFWKTLRIPIH